MVKIEDNRLICKCIDCIKNFELHFDKVLINRFANIYQFCNKDIDKFILLLRKGIYPYEYMVAGRHLMKNRYLIKTILIVV